MPERRVSLHSFWLASLIACTLAAEGCGSSATTSTVAPSGGKCDVSVTNNTQEVPAAGGNGSVTVNTSRDCSWSASAEASWITLSETSGQGPATVSYSVQPNPAGTPRRSRVTVAQQTVDIAQAAAPCRYEVLPSTVNVDAAGGQIGIALTTLEGCGWSVRSDVPWIANSVPAQGVGSATIRVTVAPNTAQARVGTVTVGSATVRVSQAVSASSPPTPTPQPTPTPTPTCTYRLSQTTSSVSQDPQGLTIGVTAPANCMWTATSDASWITVTDGRTGSGNGSVRLGVAANSGDARTGRVRVGTETFTVQQAGGACTFSIRPANYNAGQGADDITINVTVGSGCTWSTSVDAAWVTVASGQIGSGSGTVRLLIPANSGPPRSATVTIAGNSFTLHQEGACKAKIKPKNYHASRGPDDISIAVNADAGCSWTSSSSVSWVTVAEGATGSGDGNVRLLVDPNSGPPRSVTLTIAGQPFDLTQDGPH